MWNWTRETACHVHSQNRKALRVKLSFPQLVAELWFLCRSHIFHDVCVAKRLSIRDKSWFYFRNASENDKTLMSHRNLPTAWCLQHRCNWILVRLYKLHHSWCRRKQGLATRLSVRDKSRFTRNNASDRNKTLTCNQNSRTASCLQRQSRKPLHVTLRLPKLVTEFWYACTSCIIHEECVNKDWQREFMPVTKVHTAVTTRSIETRYWCKSEQANSMPHT